MKLLGIDYGTKKVGVAISDEMGNFAFPHSVLLNNKELIPALGAIIEREGIGEVVIGESKNYSMGDNPVMQDVFTFKNTLMETAGVETHLELEILTTQQAEREQGATNMTDASAAALILGSFLQKRHGYEL
jgi:putative Holliday junction resolvase